VRFLMLAASSGFGFLILAHHWGTMAAASAFGLLGALAAYKIGQLAAGCRVLPVLPAPDDALTGPQPATVG